MAEELTTLSLKLHRERTGRDQFATYQKSMQFAGEASGYNISHPMVHGAGVRHYSEKEMKAAGPHSKIPETTPQGTMQWQLRTQTSRFKFHTL